MDTHENFSHVLRRDKVELPRNSKEGAIVKKPARRKTASGQASRAMPLFTLGLPPESRKALDKAAAAEQRASAWIARRCIEEWLRREGYLK